MKQSALKVNHLYYSIRKILILKNVTFDVPDGCICALLGKNGAGKTTIIKCVLSLIKTYKGSIQAYGLNAHEPRSRINIAYIPEKEQLPNQSVQSFLLEIASYNNMIKKDALIQIKKLIKVFDFPAKFLKSNMAHLSSGLKKIVIIMQAFMGNFKLVIADEPTANLDFETRMRFFKFVAAQVQQGTTFIISSHNVLEIKEFANYYISIRHGKVESVSTKPPKINW